MWIHYPKLIDIDFYILIQTRKSEIIKVIEGFLMYKWINRSQRDYDSSWSATLILESISKNNRKKEKQTEVKIKTIIPKHRDKCSRVEKLVIITSYQKRAILKFITYAVPVMDVQIVCNQYRMRRCVEFKSRVTARSGRSPFRSPIRIGINSGSVRFHQRAFCDCVIIPTVPYSHSHSTFAVEDLEQYVHLFPAADVRLWIRPAASADGRLSPHTPFHFPQHVIEWILHERHADSYAVSRPDIYGSNALFRASCLTAFWRRSR